jgi:lipopolysaccharide heptosyltransferase I
MTDILFIKTSSLGDVIHHMPALTEARQQCRGARLAWVVEETYAPLVSLHPGVHEVIPVAWRRWRRSLYAPATLAEIAASTRAIRARRYDEIIDTQGLIRSAAIGRIARGRRHGFDSASIREPPASMLYDVRHRIGCDVHVIERNRMLTGLALGYVPQGAPDYGLKRGRTAAAGQRYAVLLHGTARLSKEWAPDNWIALAAAIESNGFDVALLSGTAAETARSERMAAALLRTHVKEPQSLLQIADLIGGAALVVGLDSGFTHLAAAFGVPLVAIFTDTDAVQAAPVGSGPIGIVGAKGNPPSVDMAVRAVERIAS